MGWFTIEDILIELGATKEQISKAQVAHEEAVDNAVWEAQMGDDL